MFMYALLCDIFAPKHKIFLKAHPGDKSDYSKVFKNEIILEKEIPAELIRFLINKKFDTGICTFSSSIRSVAPYINDIYNIDDTVVEFKDKIFKLLVLFELAKSLNLNVKYEKDSFIDFFRQYYSLNGNNYIKFNCYAANDEDIVVKDQYFETANVIIEINKILEDSNISKDIKNTEMLYIRVNDLILKKQIINFKFIKALPLSKVNISICQKEL